MLRRFFKPQSVQEACNLLKENSENCKVIAGGTDLLVNIQNGKIAPEVLIDLSKLDELKKIQVDEDIIKIGSLVTMNDLADSRELKESLPALAQAAKSVGATQIRNRATRGGNIINASPGADGLAALVAFDPEIVLRKIDSLRKVALKEFIQGPNKTSIASDEILTEIIIRVPNKKAKMKFRKISRRNAAAVSLLNTTFILQIEDNVIEEARIVIGAILPTTRRFNIVEEFLKHKVPSDELFIQAGLVARDYILSEVRAEDLANEDLMYEYKLMILPDLVTKMLKETSGMGE